ncbi:MAG: hypothetical protein CMM87_05915 [Rickettsiales bacterium]|nr:hypothetical protein [Rickettsiales bacterium]|tara:strand:- start:4886 stop:6064 length:1179 start_codon:yes stop_codon:yes gene_type:complete
MKLKMNRFKLVALVIFLSWMDCFSVVPEELQFAESAEENFQRWKASGLEEPEQWVKKVLLENHTDPERMPPLIILPAHWGDFLEKKGLKEVIPTQPSQKRNKEQYKNVKQQKLKYCNGLHWKLMQDLIDDADKSPLQDADLTEMIDRMQATISFSSLINDFFEICGSYLNIDMSGDSIAVSVRGKKRKAIEELVNMMNSDCVLPPIDSLVEKITQYNEAVLRKRKEHGGRPLSKEELGRFKKRRALQRGQHAKLLKAKSVLDGINELRLRYEEIQQEQSDLKQSLANEIERLKNLKGEIEKQKIILEKINFEIGLANLQWLRTIASDIPNPKVVNKQQEKVNGLQAVAAGIEEAIAQLKMESEKCRKRSTGLVAKIKACSDRLSQLQHPEEN